MMVLKTVTSEDMENNGRKTAKILKAGDVILLYGELGSGKSTFTKGIAKELGVENATTSPTFNLMSVYKTTHKKIKYLIHADAYRLKSQEEIEDIGLNDFLFKNDSVCIVEWPDKLKNIIKGKKVIEVHIEYIDKERRKITVENDKEVTLL